MASEARARRVWRISPDGNGRKWELWRKHECIAFGWPSIEDYRILAARGELQATVARGDDRGDGKTDFRRVTHFAFDMDVGDLVIAGGTKAIYGIGIIASDYRPKADPTNPLRNDPDHPHIRSVQWVDVEPFKLENPMFQPNALEELNQKRWADFADRWSAQPGGTKHLERIHDAWILMDETRSTTDQLGTLDVDAKALEGAKLFAWRAHHRRDQQFRDQVLHARPSLACEVCGFDFARVYGDLGQRYAHVHHEDALAGRGGQDAPTTPDRVKIVCANCHAMIHRYGECRSVDDIKSRIAAARRAANP